MDSLPLTHPVERLLLGLTLAAFVSVVCWKAGAPPISPPASTIVQPS